MPRCYGNFPNVCDKTPLLESFLYRRAFNFENIISGIQLYNKRYHQKLNHSLETEKDE